MKIGAVGLGNRIAHVFHELSQINHEAKLVAYVDPLPIGKDYSEKHNFFPKKTYATLDEMVNPRLATLSEIAWCSEAKRPWSQFRSSLLNNMDHLAKMGWKFHSF